MDELVKARRLKAENDKLREALTRLLRAYEPIWKPDSLDHWFVKPQEVIQAEAALNDIHQQHLVHQQCTHERLNEDGICRSCGEDRRGI